MEFIQALGLSAATLTSLSGLPQLIKIIKSKHTKDLSLEMILILVTGISLWLAYGFMKTDAPLIFGNIVSLCIYIPILAYKLKYK